MPGSAAPAGNSPKLNAESKLEVVGVTPKEFHGTFFAFEMDGYLSLNP